jgi:hypothetical protein
MNAFYNTGSKCFLEELPPPVKGQQVKFKRRCKQWISSDQSWSLDKYFKDRIKRA